MVRHHAQAADKDGGGGDKAATGWQRSYKVTPAPTAVVVVRWWVATGATSAEFVNLASCRQGSTF